MELQKNNESLDQINDSKNLNSIRPQWAKSFAYFYICLIMFIISPPVGWIFFVAIMFGGGLQIFLYILNSILMIISSYLLLSKKYQDNFSKSVKIFTFIPLGIFIGFVIRILNLF